MNTGVCIKCGETVALMANDKLREHLRPSTHGGVTTSVKCLGSKRLPVGYRPRVFPPKSFSPNLSMNVRHVIGEDNRSFTKSPTTGWWKDVEHPDDRLSWRQINVQTLVDHTYDTELENDETGEEA